MTSEQYRTYLVESVRIAAQMIFDQAEDIVGHSDRISGLIITADFDPSAGSIPELKIIRSHLPSKEQYDCLMDIRQKAKLDKLKNNLELLTKKEKQNAEN